MNESKWSRSSRQISRVGLPSVFQLRSVVVLIGSKPGGSTVGTLLRQRQSKFGCLSQKPSKALSRSPEKSVRPPSCN